MKSENRKNRKSKMEIYKLENGIFATYKWNFKQIKGKKRLISCFKHNTVLKTT